MMKNSLKMVLPVLKGTYKSIDIRAVLAKSKRDKLWYCIILKVHLTNQDVNTTKEKQKKGQVCRTNNNLLKVVFGCKRIDQIESFLKDIQKGKIKVNRILARPIGYGPFVFHLFYSQVMLSLCWLPTIDNFG